MIEKCEQYVAKDNDGLLVTGDFNLVMDTTVDRNNSDTNHHKSLATLQAYMEKSHLCDAWRLRHPTERLYTWHRWNKEHRPLCSRIDMTLVPLSLLDCLENCKIEHGQFTDHSLVSITLKTDEFRRGPGIWKFNNLLLNDTTFCEGLIDVVNKNSKNPWLDDNENWEYIKLCIGKYCKEYSRTKAKKARYRENQLSKLRDKLIIDSVNNPRDGDIVKNLEKVNETLEEIAIGRAESSIFRSRCNYAKEGEKCTSFFMSLEKKRYLEKNMKCIILDDGRHVTHQNEILKEQTRFYQTLYQKDDSVTFSLKPSNTERILNNMEREYFEQPLSIDELFDAVMTLKSGKVPGLDGLTVEFYRKFWKTLAPFLFAMYQFSHKNGLLPESVRQGLITLLPKGNKDIRYVKNMRPLAMLCNDQKILSKALDNRLRTILPNIISTDQNGFVSNRKISHNIRKSLDIIEFTKQKRIPGIILSIDMEKCFDRLSHQAILGALRYYNFGENFINWVALSYNNFQICTQNFGYTSKFWTKGRGVVQGCPLSPSLYLFIAEIMANKIRNNPKIRGIHVNDVEYLISQFADDTDLFLSFSQETITEVFKTFNDIEANTGLLISYEKTTIYRIGSLARSDAKLITPRKITWSNDYISTLGVNISNSEKILKRNFDIVLSKMRAVSNMWYFKTMTISGKIVIINSLMASLYVYKMQVLHQLTPNDIEKIEQTMEEFLWKGKRAKIPLSTLKISKVNGGLGLVDIKSKHEALLCNWITDCEQNQSISNLAEAFLGPAVKDSLIWQFNLTQKESKKLFPGNSFWHKIIHIWHDFSFHHP